MGKDVMWQPLPQNPEWYRISNKGEVERLAREYNTGNPFNGSYMPKKLDRMIMKQTPSKHVTIRLPNGTSTRIHVPTTLAEMSWP